MKVYLEKSKCSGCTACKCICPQKAIDMKQDEKGFLYPVVNEEICISCGLCKKVCAFNENYIISTTKDKPVVFGVQHKDKKERRTSRSGGAFMAFSNWILSNNGVVYGAAFEHDFKVIHKRITDKLELKCLKGSKYVQSYMNDTFDKVKEDIKSGKNVLFSGTPCQVAGLRKFLGYLDKSENFYTCDIVCHGVPSPNIWKDYLQFIEKKYKMKISKAEFRDKSFGWGYHKESFWSDDKKISTNYFTQIFYKNLDARDSCSKCVFANTVRPSDITIGDFWGVEKALPNMYANEGEKLGTSLVFVNTDKGERLFESSNKDLFFEKTSIEKSLQPNLRKPTEYNEKEKEFWKDYNNESFEYLLKKYTSYGLENKFKFKVKQKCIRYLKAVKRRIGGICNG